MFAVSSCSDAPVPIFTLIPGTAGAASPSQQAHPAGRGPGGQRLSLDALTVIAAGLAQTVPEADHSWIRGARRSYTQLLQTDLYDAWMISWLPSGNLELHDHGGSLGAVAVASGKLVEAYTDLRWRHPVRHRVINHPETITIPRTRVHEVSNPGPERAVSVHVYSPPLSSMTFFDPRPANFLATVGTTEGDLAALEEGTA
jgi:Cysteine dioxygenase type I